jgi:uracil-DNA glycosylase
LNSEIPLSGDLSKWATEGVLLLNTTLTVRRGEAGSHFGKGWERFTDEVIRKINDRSEGTVFILWGGPSRKKTKLIDPTKHLVLEANHPSPLSANRGGFFGCRHFSKTNVYLTEKGKNPIDWSL